MSYIAGFRRRVMAVTQEQPDTGGLISSPDRCGALSAWARASSERVELGISRCHSAGGRPPPQIGSPAPGTRFPVRTAGQREPALPTSQAALRSDGVDARGDCAAEGDGTIGRGRTCEDTHDTSG